MPDVEIKIGGRSFAVACQAGEESFLRTASRLLDIEATVLTGQIGHIPEAKMLLMAGLMLADKTAGLEEQMRVQTEKDHAQETLIAELRARPVPAPERVEVAVIPPMITETLSEIAARAEALAAQVAEKLADKLTGDNATPS